MVMKSRFVPAAVLLLAITAMAWSSGGQDGTTAGKPHAGITIRVLTDQRVEIVKLKELTPALEAQTGMRVEYIVAGEGPLDDKVALEFSAPSTSIDVSFLKFFLLKDYAKKGFLQPMDQLMSTPRAMDHFGKSVLNIGRVDEKLYGIPQMMDPNVLAYRADIFAQHGLRVPQTMTELMTTAKYIKENVPGMYGIASRGNRGGRPNWDWSSFLKAWGGNYLDAEGRPTVNTPQAVQSLEFYTELLTKYGPPGVADYNWQDVQDALASGKVAIMYDGAAQAARVAKPKDPNYSKFADKISFAIVPKGPVARESGYFSWMLVIPRGSKQENKKASMAFVEWAFKPEIAKQVGWGAAAEVVYDIPPYAGYREAKNLKDVFTEALKYSSQDYRPLIPQLNQLMDIVDLAINMSLAGIKTPKAALDEAQAALEKLLVK